MQVIQTLIKLGQGLFKSGNLLVIFGRILLAILGFLLAIIGHILRFGFRIFIIFLSEALFFASKGVEHIEKAVNNAQITLNYLLQKLQVFSKDLIPNVTLVQGDVSGMESLINFLTSLKNLLLLIFNFLLAISIILISVYWLLTYTETIGYLSEFITEKILKKEVHIVQYFNELLFSLDNKIYNLISIHIFSVYVVWGIRIIGFSAISLHRYWRFSKSMNSQNFKNVLNRVWNEKSNNQNLTFNTKQIGYILISIIAFASLIWILINNNNEGSTITQETSQELYSTDTINNKSKNSMYLEEIKYETQDTLTNDKNNMGKAVMVEHKKTDNRVLKNSLTKIRAAIISQKDSEAIQGIDNLLNNKELVIKEKDKIDISSAKAFLIGEERELAVKILSKIITE